MVASRLAVDLRLMFERKLWLQLKRILRHALSPAQMAQLERGPHTRVSSHGVLCGSASRRLLGYASEEKDDDGGDSNHAPGSSKAGGGGGRSRGTSASFGRGSVKRKQQSALSSFMSTAAVRPRCLGCSNQLAATVGSADTQPPPLCASCLRALSATRRNAVAPPRVLVRRPGNSFVMK